MPFASDVTLPPTALPPPLCTLNATLAPEIAFPNASVTRTDGLGVTLVATANGPDGEDIATSALAGAAAAVAVKMTGDATPVTLAVSVSAPATKPSVHSAAVATPFASVATVGLPSVPLFAPTVKLTLTFGTGSPMAESTRTAGAGLTTLPTVAVIVVDVWAAMLAGAGAR